MKVTILGRGNAGCCVVVGTPRAFRAHHCTAQSFCGDCRRLASAVSLESFSSAAGIEPAAATTLWGPEMMILVNYLILIMVNLSPMMIQFNLVF